MTLSLDFQGQIKKKLYLRNDRADCCETTLWPLSRSLMTMTVTYWWPRLSVRTYQVATRVTSGTVSHLCLRTVLDSKSLRSSALHWRHNDYDGVSNHQPHAYLLNRLFKSRSKKTSKLCVTSLCVGNSPGPVNSPHKGPVTRKMFPFDDVIMGFTSLSEPLDLRQC